MINQICLNFIQRLNVEKEFFFFDKNCRERNVTIVSRKQ